MLVGFHILATLVGADLFHYRRCLPNDDSPAWQSHTPWRSEICCKPVMVLGQNSPSALIVSQIESGKWCP